MHVPTPSGRVEAGRSHVMRSPRQTGVDSRRTHAGSMGKAMKRILWTSVAVQLALALLPDGAEGTQTITTCQAVGCHGGQPGCYWYQASGLDHVVWCYGRR